MQRVLIGGTLCLALVFAAGSAQAGCPDGDGDGFGPCNGDCDDGDATVYPGAPEVCDGVDNDCDGALLEDGPHGATGGSWSAYTSAANVNAHAWRIDVDSVLTRIEIWANIDAGATTTWVVYESATVDGTYTLTHSVAGSSPAAGAQWQSSPDMAFPLQAGRFYVIGISMARAWRHYGSGGYTSAVTGFGERLFATAIDGQGPPPASHDFVSWYSNAVRITVSHETDNDGDGAASCSATPDCDDSDPLVFPGNPELCDSLDNDCNGQVDDGAPDQDGDGICDTRDDCPYDAPPDDLDNDGICNVNDVCFGDNSTGDSDGDSVCDDSDVCFGDDTAGDTDFDGICDDLDSCVGDDASGDSDGDGVCDDSDPCFGDDASGDSDGDGVCDSDDLCLGNDASGDDDLDGVCDDSDVCLGDDASGDDDADGICNSADLCWGDDAAGDSDGDGICDDGDVCLGDDASGDSDGDGVCDSDDLCLGDDASGDADGDGICDDGDLCMGADASGDADGDGWCAEEAGTAAGDCDDDNEAVFPGADEGCDGIDTDCDGELGVDEADADGDGDRICDGDCDDENEDMEAGGVEICDDGIDNDCNGEADGDDAVCAGGCSCGEGRNRPGVGAALMLMLGGQLLAVRRYTPK